MTSKRRDPRGHAEPKSPLEPLDSRAIRAAALDSLARRDHASEDLRRKLIDKGYDREAVGTVVERLAAEKLVDDRRYVENFVSYHAARGHGPLRVRAKLRNQGLEGEWVDDAVDAYPEWIAQLQRADRKKFGTQPATLYPDRQRRARFLAYRGFTGAQIRMALGIDTDLDVDS